VKIAPPIIFKQIDQHIIRIHILELIYSTIILGPSNGLCYLLAGGDKGLGAEKARSQPALAGQAREKCSKSRRIPSFRCKLCRAGFSRPVK
jgi:hypothetical protein